MGLGYTTICIYVYVYIIYIYIPGPVTKIAPKSLGLEDEFPFGKQNPSYKCYLLVLVTRNSLR